MLSRNSFSDGSRAGRRGRSRLRLRLPARLTTVSATTPVILLDLSLTGAKITAPQAAKTGQQCFVNWEGHEAFGTLVWVRSGMCGIAFDRAITPAQLIETRDRFDCDPLPDDHELLCRAALDWVAGRRLA